MPNQMNEDYFDEKKELSLKLLMDARKDIDAAIALVSAYRYEMPNLVDASETHSLVKGAMASARLGRYNFEKARWAGARTGKDFDDWLQDGPGKDLL